MSEMGISVKPGGGKKLQAYDKETGKFTDENGKEIIKFVPRISNDEDEDLKKYSSLEQQKNLFLNKNYNHKADRDRHFMDIYLSTPIFEDLIMKKLLNNSNFSQLYPGMGFPIDPEGKHDKNGIDYIFDTLYGQQLVDLKTNLSLLGTKDNIKKFQNEDFKLTVSLVSEDQYYKKNFRYINILPDYLFRDNGTSMYAFNVILSKYQWDDFLDNENFCANQNNISASKTYLCAKEDLSNFIKENYKIPFAKSKEDPNMEHYQMHKDVLMKLNSPEMMRNPNLQQQIFEGFKRNLGNENLKLERDRKSGYMQLVQTFPSGTELVYFLRNVNGKKSFNTALHMTPKEVVAASGTPRSFSVIESTPVDVESILKEVNGNTKIDFGKNRKLKTLNELREGVNKGNKRDLLYYQALVEAIKGKEGDITKLYEEMKPYKLKDYYANENRLD